MDHLLANRRLKRFLEVEIRQVRVTRGKDSVKLAPPKIQVCGTGSQLTNRVKSNLVMAIPGELKTAATRCN